MLTEVKAFSSWRSAPTLPLIENGRSESDLIQLRNIDGLDPVKASVSTTPYGAVDGASYTGSSVLTRNIVLTLHPNPNWDIWTYESLRRLLYSYFIPKKETRLEFLSDDMIPVEISGIVESCEVNMFSKDQELLVSIICPDPYFTSVDPIVITGQTSREGVAPRIVEYNGTVESGIHAKLTWVTDPAPSLVEIRFGDPEISHFTEPGTVSEQMYWELSSIPMRKFVQNVNLGTGVINNLLSKVIPGSTWPTLQPGENELYVITDQGEQDYEITYFERFGGL